MAFRPHFIEPYQIGLGQIEGALFDFARIGEGLFEFTKISASLFEFGEIGCGQFAPVDSQWKINE